MKVCVLSLRFLKVVIIILRGPKDLIHVSTLIEVKKIISRSIMQSYVMIQCVLYLLIMRITVNIQSIEWVIFLKNTSCDILIGVSKNLFAMLSQQKCYFAYKNVFLKSSYIWKHFYLLLPTHMVTLLRRDKYLLYSKIMNIFWKVPKSSCMHW